MEKAKKICPFCKKEILRDAVKCKHCHEWLDGRKEIPIPIPRYSNAQDPRRFLTITILSAFLYTYYWYFRSWRYLKEYRGLNINPLLMTIVGHAPIVSIFFDYKLFSMIHEFGDDLGCKNRYSPALMTLFSTLFYIVSWIITYTKSKVSDAPIYLLLTIIGISIACFRLLIFYYIQLTINDIWSKKQPTLKIREDYSEGEFVIIVVGIIVWISALIDVFMKILGISI